MTVAALIIDMQVDFFAHPRLASRRAELVSRTNSLVAITRAAGCPVIWIRQEFSPDLSDASLEVRRNQTKVVIRGTPGAAILPELDQRDIDYLILKNRYSAFFRTPLDELLERLECDQLVIAGVNTHACIRTTVVDAYQRDLDVILAKDCIDSLDAEHHENAWRYMDGKLGRGMDNQQLQSWLEGPRHRF
ncbi:cysteine hydrolase family protein [Luteibacter sp. RCC_6_2]|uniref:cysteine hydrolase family protein n=1 Tax=Luteibacter sp. RCC_6_2 TaxID=3239223 RepID=UPI0035252DD0